MRSIRNAGSSSAWNNNFPGREIPRRLDPVFQSRCASRFGAEIREYVSAVVPETGSNMIISSPSRKAAATRRATSNSCAKSVTKRKAISSSEERLPRRRQKRRETIFAYKRQGARKSGACHRGEHFQEPTGIDRQEDHD